MEGIPEIYTTYIQHAFGPDTPAISEVERLAQDFEASPRTFTALSLVSSAS